MHKAEVLARLPRQHSLPIRHRLILTRANQTTTEILLGTVVASNVADLPRKIRPNRRIVHIRHRQTVGTLSSKIRHHASCTLFTEHLRVTGLQRGQRLTRLQVVAVEQRITSQPGKRPPHHLPRRRPKLATVVRWNPHRLGLVHQNRLRMVILALHEIFNEDSLLVTITDLEIRATLVICATQRPVKFLVPVTVTARKRGSHIVHHATHNVLLTLSRVQTHALTHIRPILRHLRTVHHLGDDLLKSFLVRATGRIQRLPVAGQVVQCTLIQAVLRCHKLQVSHHGSSLTIRQRLAGQAHAGRVLAIQIHSPVQLTIKVRVRALVTHGGKRRIRQVTRRLRSLFLERIPVLGVQELLLVRQDHAILRRQLIH